VGNSPSIPSSESRVIRSFRLQGPEGKLSFLTEELVRALELRGVNKHMRDEQPLKQILSATRGHWDRPEIRTAVRENFAKMIDCRTPALGAEVYASETEEKLVYHTCKSRACPSCGHRATQLGNESNGLLFPDIPYSGIVLTMPDRLWPIFQQNRQPIHCWSGIAGAALVRAWQHAICRCLPLNRHG